MLDFLVFGILLALITLAFLIVITTLEQRKPRIPGLSYDSTKPITYGVLTFLAVWLTTPFYYEFSGWPCSIPVSFGSGGQVIRHPYGMFTVGLGGKYSNLPIQNIDCDNTPTVTVLTENTKVRMIFHRIFVKIADEQKFYNADSKRHGSHTGTSQSGLGGEDRSLEKYIKTLVNRRLYDFNNSNSRELAQFFNPLEPEQQDEYQYLIRKYLNSALADDGLEVVAASFNIQ